MLGLPVQRRHRTLRRASVAMALDSGGAAPAKPSCGSAPACPPASLPAHPSPAAAPAEARTLSPPLPHMSRVSTKLPAACCLQTALHIPGLGTTNVSCVHSPLHQKHCGEQRDCHTDKHHTETKKSAHHSPEMQCLCYWLHSLPWSWALNPLRISSMSPITASVTLFALTLCRA